jgi:hypothetical protein
MTMISNGDNARDPPGKSTMFYHFRSEEIMANCCALSRDRIF